MYKIKFLTTGHIFLLPEKDAKTLKEKFPDEYKILEKNGKKYNDRKMKKKKEINFDDIREFVIDED
ncbi:hypothetical protein IKQ21_03985 [bacterium]|nr:hypothetical protein [bacterium]